MLSGDQIEEFYDRGFIVQPDVFSGSEVEQMRAAFVRLEGMARQLGRTRTYRGARFVLEKIKGNSEARSVRIHRIVWCGAAEPVLSAYGRDRRLLTMAARLLGSGEMNQLINQAHFKLPGDGVEFPWHQDSTHRRFGQGQWKDVNRRGSYVQTITAIDDVTEENGPLWFIPGSCRQGHIDLPEDGQLPSALADPAEAVSVTMTAGSVLLFGPYTLHCSQPNISDGPRRAFINGFAYPGANSRVYPGRGAGRLLRVSLRDASLAD